MSDLKNVVVILGGTPYALKWDKGAMYRADELGLFEKRKPGIGLAAAAKYVWCMAPAALRERCAGPEQVAELLDVAALRDVWDAINNAVSASRDVPEKNGNGSTNGPSPASS